jgi:hypothetical protein
MEKAGNYPLFVEPGALGKVQQIDAVKLVIRAVFDQPLNRIGHHWIGGLFQHGELGLAVVHAGS